MPRCQGARGPRCHGAAPDLPFAIAMAIRRYEDLDCWKLATELKVKVYALLDHSPAKRDVKFCEQLKKSASSGPANLAEGFGAYEHGDSNRYARVAKGSLTETHNHLLDGVDRQFWTRDRIEDLLILAKRALGATIGWMRHLATTDAPPARWENEVSQQRRTRRRPRSN